MCSGQINPSRANYDITLMNLLSFFTLVLTCSLTSQQDVRQAEESFRFVPSIPEERFQVLRFGPESPREVTPWDHCMVNTLPYENICFHEQEIIDVEEVVKKEETDISEKMAIDIPMFGVISKRDMYIIIVCTSLGVIIGRGLC